MRNSQRRKRRNIIIFLFAIVIFMFGGFYYFYNDINIKGVGSTTGTFKVLVSDVIIKESTGISSNKSKIPSFSNDSIEFYPFLNSPNESISYTITIENQGAIDAKYRIVPKLDEKNPGVKIKMQDGEQWSNLKSGEKNEIDITLYYDNNYEGNPTGDFSYITVNLESMQNTEEYKTVEIAKPEFKENGSSLIINYPNGCGRKYTCTYQKDLNKEVTVKQKTVEVKFPSSGIVTAKVSDNYNTVSNSYSITVNPIMKVWHSNSKDDFHSDEYKTKITYAEFIDNINIPSNVKNWDISYENNGSVIAYIVDNEVGGYNLYIGGTGEVQAKDLSYMFYGFENLQNINTSKLNTSNTIAMKGTFENCHKLTALDLRNFNTSNVVVMNNMFKNSNNLKTIYVSNAFITTQVLASKNMFQGCTSLVGQTGKIYDAQNVDKVSASASGYFTTI